MGPQGKVPAGIRGLTKAMKGELASERAQKWEASEAHSVDSWIRRSPAWAISMALHLVAAVILMNVVYFTNGARIGQVFRMTLRASAPGGAKQGDQDNGINGKHNEDQAPAGKPDPNAPDSVSPGMPPKETVAGGVPIKIDTGPTSGKDGPGGIYAGRGGAGRGNALRQFGGDGVSEQAVVDGLEWLAKHQSKSGAWDPEGFDRLCPKGDSCGGDDRGHASYVGATTGLALLAFLGAGYSHMDDHLRPKEEGGPVTHAYTPAITRGLKYLCREQEKDGCIDPSGVRNLYCHGIAALALVEAFSMTHDAALRPNAQLAINFLVEAQQDSGGWNYTPEPMNRSDTSITSWAVMVMRSARAAGLAVPKRSWDNARRFMHAVTDYKTGNIGYCLQGPPARVTRGCNAMVAIGMATRTYLGMPDDQMLSGKLVEQIEAVPPHFDETPGSCPNWGGLSHKKGEGHWSLYYTYYATLALFHHGGEPWEKWNKLMREATIPKQRQDGHAKGSWDPVVWDGAWGGRIYTTAFNVMNLEVYYRYLPCYQVGAEFGLSKLVSDTDWDSVVEGARRGRFDEVKGTETEGPVEEPAKATPPKPAARDVAGLVADLKSDEMMTRRNAARELCQREEKTAVEALILAAKVEKTSLRPVLIEYLGSFKGEKAILAYLVDELDSDQDRIRTAALTALHNATGETNLGSSPEKWRTWLKAQDAEKK